MKKRFWIIPALFCLLPLGAGTVELITLPHAGNAFDRFSEKTAVVRHTKYSDTLVATRSDSNLLVLPVQAPPGEVIRSLTVSAEIQASVPFGPALEVGVALPGNAEVVPLFVLRGSKAYAFETGNATLAGLNVRRAELRFRFRGVWANGSGESNLLLRGIRVTAETEKSEQPLITFRNRRNIFTPGDSTLFYAAQPGTFEIVNAPGTLRRSVKTGAEQNGLSPVDAGPLPPGFYSVFHGKTEAARFAVVAADIQAHAAKSVAQVDFGRNGLWPLDLTRRAAELARLAGVTWVRERWGFSWRSIEPERDKFITGPMTDFLKIEKENHLKTTFILMDAPHWAGAGYGDDLRDTFRIARTLAKKFDGLIDAWEYWNEPDSWPFGKGPAHNYAAAQKAATLGFRAYDPAGRIPVATAGISSIARKEFIEDMLSDGLPGYFDIYNSHIYEFPGNYPWVYDRHIELQNRFGFLNRRKWITEGGAESARIDAKANPPRFQKEVEIPAELDLDTARCDIMPPEVRRKVTADLVKNWVLSAAWRWDKYFTFCFVYYNEAGGGRVWGMLGPGMTATSSYAALATYNHLLGDLDYAGRITGLPKGTAGHLFSGGDRFRAVLWADTPTEIELPRLTALYAMTGDALDLPSGKLKLGSDPIYAELGTPPRVERDQKLFQKQFESANIAAVSPVVLDFVRDTSAGRFRVNDQRQHIITKFGEAVNGTLFLYNFGKTPYRGTVTTNLPSGWKAEYSAAPVEIPADGRISFPVALTAPNRFFPDRGRVEFQTDSGRSCTVLTFRCDAALNAIPVSPLDHLELRPAAPSTGSWKNGVFALDFSGDTPTIELTTALSPDKADGIMFTLGRDGKAGPSYIDVTVRNRDGSTSRLKPNLFPVFLDGVDRETHVIRYDRLTPKTDSANAVELVIGFCSFGAQKFEMKCFDAATWREVK